MPEIINDHHYSSILTRLAIASTDRSLATLTQECQDDFSRTGSPIAQILLAYALWRSNDYSQAFDAFPNQLPAHVDPTFYWNLKASIQKHIPSQLEAAADSYHRALEANPSSTDVLYNYGNLVREDNPSQAILLYRKSLSIEPLNAQCWHNLGTVYYNQGAFEASQFALRISLTLDPLNPNVWCDYGNTLQSLDRFPAATRCFLQSLDCDPTLASAHTNLGSAYLHSKPKEAALHHLIKGVTHSNGSAQALWNLSLAYLALGDYTKGWELYESRLSNSVEPISTPPISKPILDSIDHPELPSSKVLVWTEQGIGDEIQFIRYLQLLDSAHINYSVLSRASLIELNTGWFESDVRFLSSPSQFNANDYDFHVPLMSLPKLFGTQLSTIPSSLPYYVQKSPTPSHLTVDPQAGQLSIGIVWASDQSNKAMYRHKSISLCVLADSLRPFLRAELVNLHSLQVGPDSAQISQLQLDLPISDWSTSLLNFSDTAYVVNQLDLVISVDTAVAHLSSALGRPTWILLPHQADFRWLQDRTDSPWYPGITRLIRQSEHGNWRSVISQIHQGLNRIFALSLPPYSPSSNV